MTRLEEQFMNRVPYQLKNIEKCLDTRTIAAIMFAQSYVCGYLQATKKHPGATFVAERAIEYADALINELNK